MRPGLQNILVYGLACHVLVSVCLPCSSLNVLDKPEKLRQSRGTIDLQLLKFQDGGWGNVLPGHGYWHTSRDGNIWVWSNSRIVTNRAKQKIQKITSTHTTVQTTNIKWGCGNESEYLQQGAVAFTGWAVTWQVPTEFMTMMLVVVVVVVTL